jgi:hypothetical protein
MKEAKQHFCDLCNHSLEDNLHGFDQNDYYFDASLDTFVHCGSCTYCKECNPALKKALENT